MGKGTAKVLAAIDNHIHEIIILCRSDALGKAVIEEIERDTSNKKISIIVCDLAKLSDVRKAVKEIQSKHNYLDGIFINAGLGYASNRVEADNEMDSHFQVNYLSQFMLTLNLLDLLESSENGGRVIFNVNKGGNIFWDDMQMKNKWGYVRGIQQSMAAKRMFLYKLHRLCRSKNKSKLSFIGFQIPKTVWSNQVNIIPAYMKIMASAMKFLGAFISIERCGEIIAPLFTEKQNESLKKSGKFITWKKKGFVYLKEEDNILDKVAQNRLWEISIELCADESTSLVSEFLHSNA